MSNCSTIAQSIVSLEDVDKCEFKEPYKKLAKVEGFFLYLSLLKIYGWSYD